MVLSLFFFIVVDLWPACIMGCYIEPYIRQNAASTLPVVLLRLQILAGADYCNLMFALDRDVPSGVSGCQEACRKTQGALPPQNKSWMLVKFLRRELKGFSGDHLENMCIS